MAHCVNVVCVFVCSCIHTVRFISFRFLFVCLFVDKHLFVWDSECVCMSCDRCEDAPQRHRPHDDNREINGLSPHPPLSS